MFGPGNVAARRRSPESVFGDTVLSERRTVTALADLLSDGYDVAHLGAPILLSYVPIWFVALGNCWLLPFAVATLGPG